MLSNTMPFAVTHCSISPRNPIGFYELKLAGEVGIEPTNAGIKIRCLTTWRLPKNSFS